MIYSEFVQLSDTPYLAKIDRLGVVQVYIYCRHTNCINRAEYGPRNSKKALYCEDHKKDDMIQISAMNCKYIDCQNEALYGYYGSDAKLCCSKHRSKGMILMSDDKCLDCTANAYYGYPKGRSLYCEKHKKDLMIRLPRVECVEKDCTKDAIYNYYGESEKLYCADHRLIGMTKITVLYCTYIGCCDKARYGYVGLRPLRCLLHREEDMVEVQRRTVCKKDGCRLYPNYNYYWKRYGAYCIHHKLKDMERVNVKSKRLCQYEDCTVRASYGRDGVALRCYYHREDDMQVVRRMTACKYVEYCEIDGKSVRCERPAEYNYKNSRMKLYCEEHKLPNMVRIKNRRECTVEDCDKEGTYIDSSGYRYCAVHKTAEMTMAKYTICIIDGCPEPAQYNYSNYRTPKYCKYHANIDMVYTPKRRSRKRKRQS